MRLSEQEIEQKWDTAIEECRTGFAGKVNIAFARAIEAATIERCAKLIEARAGAGVSDEDCTLLDGAAALRKLIGEVNS